MNKAILNINNKKLEVELAKNFLEISYGLMNRDFLEKDSGMLFIFPIPMQLHFWGKNTKIPLDLAFLDKDLSICELYAINPLDETVILSLSKTLMYALEVNFGWFKTNEIQVGDKVKIINS